MPWSTLLPSLRRALRWHRRLLAAGLAALAVYCILTVVTQDDRGVAVVAAARTVPGGAALADGDLTILLLPAEAVPDGALTNPADALGRTVVAQLPARAVLTAGSLTSGGALVADGRVALPVTLADSAPVGLLRVGDRIDLLGTGGSGAVEVLASSVRVVTIPDGDAGGLLGTAERVILVDLTPEQAARVVAAAAGSSLEFALR